VLPALEAVRPGAAARIARSRAAAEAEIGLARRRPEAVGDVVRAAMTPVSCLPETAARISSARSRARAAPSAARAGTAGRTGRNPVAVEFISSGASGSRLELAGGSGSSASSTACCCARPRRAGGPADVPLEIRPRIRGRARSSQVGRGTSARWAPRPQIRGARITASFDPSSLRFPLELRAWRPGDRIRLPYGSKKLKKLLQERRVGRARAPRVPVLCDADGSSAVGGRACARGEARCRGGRGFTITVGGWRTQLTCMTDRRPGVRRIVYSQEDIARRVAEMGRRSRALPEGEDLLVLGLLKGSFIFLADLAREIARPLHVDFLVASSYGSGTVSTGDVRLVYDPEASLRGTPRAAGRGHHRQRQHHQPADPDAGAAGPKSLELCALLHKRIAPPLAREARWVGFDAPQEFLIGYGLDHSENYRNLPFIASL
jgi:hypoxanthine phosphoribosyltransferase